MNQVHLYLSETQRAGCLRALNTAQRWTQGDVGVFAELADEGFLRDKDGKNLSLSLWSTIVEPALTEYASLAAGTTPGVILDVHDPAVHPLGSFCMELQEQWKSVKPSKKHTTLAALPDGVQIHRIDENAFNVYNIVRKSGVLGMGEMVGKGLTEKEVAALGHIPEPVLKVAIDREKVHSFIRVVDVYSRILMNQWDTVKELTDDRWEHRRDNWHGQIEAAVKSFQEPWTGYSLHASSGIHSPNIHPEAKLVWTVQKAIRHWDIVQRLGYSSRGVSSDAPMRGDGWPFVDGDASAGLQMLPIGGGILKDGTLYYAVDSYTPGGSQVGLSLASSYSPVSLLDALAYVQKNLNQAPTF